MSHSVQLLSCSQRVVDQLTWQGGSNHVHLGKDLWEVKGPLGMIRLDVGRAFWSVTVTAVPVRCKRRLLTAAAAQGRSRLLRWCFKTPLAAVTLCFRFSGKVTDCHLMQTRTDKIGAVGLYQSLIPRKVPSTNTWRKCLGCNAGSDTSYPSRRTSGSSGAPHLSVTAYLSPRFPKLLSHWPINHQSKLTSVR